MKTINIKLAAWHGGDSKTFRAYLPGGKGKDKPLGVSASTTGNTDMGAIRCAAKAFIKFVEKHGDPDEVETRIKLVEVGDGVWHATLQPAEPTARGASLK
jgi:hypothetical protein